MNAIPNHRIGQVEGALSKQEFKLCQTAKEVMMKPKPRERMSGQVQIVTAATWEEAKKQCPWACRLQPAEDQEHQKGKWICFETDDDADFYRGL